MGTVNLLDGIDHEKVLLRQMYSIALINWIKLFIQFIIIKFWMAHYITRGSNQDYTLTLTLYFIITPLDAFEISCI